MARLLPFKGFLPHKEKASKIISKPIDTYTKAEIEAITEENKYSFVNVVSPAVGVHDEDTYKESINLCKQNFEQFVQDGLFIQDDEATLYVYRQEHHSHHFTGIIGALSVHDFLNNKIKPHEQTIEDRELKLFEYLSITKINAEPVVVVYEKNQIVDSVLESQTKKEPYFSVIKEGITHTLWRVTSKLDLELLVKHFDAMNELYICDGHHRIASSVLLSKNEASENQDANYAKDYFMSIVFPESQIKLLEFNRLVKDLNGLSEKEFLDELEKTFQITEIDTAPEPSQIHYIFGLYLNHKWYELIPKEHALTETPEENMLSSQILTDLVLSPILDIHDLRRDKRIRFAGGKTDVKTLEQKVNSGKYVAAFTVPAISVEEVKKFASKGWHMPPKSTYFEPKLLNGMVIYNLEGEL